MYLGTICMIDLASTKCSAPKTASGAAKHRLARATTLSRLRARAISVRADQSASRETTTPAAHMDITAGESLRDIDATTRISGCVFIAGTSCAVGHYGRLADLDCYNSRKAKQVVSNRIR